MVLRRWLHLCQDVASPLDACSTVGVACPLRFVALEIQDGSRGTVKDNDFSLYKAKETEST